MKIVKVCKEIEGTTLGDDAVDSRGRVVLTAGNRITQNHIRIFLTWGITEVKVKEDFKEIHDINDLKNSPVYNKAKEEVMNIFRFSDLEHPMIRELINLSLNRKILKLSQSRN